MTSKKREPHRESVGFRQIPERVHTAIATQQKASEKLVGWFQLAVVLFFGLLYVVSPKTFSRDMTFEPVPWFVAVFLGFTLVRLYLAYRRHLTSPLLYLSVVIDITLLLGMIWSFHLQYEQPPPFYLKAPTLLYVFIFIALRPLRFEARYVIFAGIAAAVGWAGMTLYAVLKTGPTNAVTRDYVAYLTANRILIGAELEKVVIILTVTAILAVAINRAHRVLIRAVAEQTAAHDLARFFSPEIARQITSAEQQISVGTGQVRDAAILMVDIRGFTRLATRIAPDDLICLLAEYQSRLVPIIQGHGGTIDKFMGDGIMATFGAAVTSGTYAADALRSVDNIMESVAAWGTELQRQGKPPLKVGAAVATGRIIFGAVGDESRLEYTVIGDAVNLAAKLEKHTKSEGVRALCPAETFATAARQGYRSPLDVAPARSSRIEGAAHPVEIVILAP